MFLRIFKDSVSRHPFFPRLTITTFWMNHLSLPHMDFDNDMLFNFIELGVRVIQLLPSSVCDCFRILPNLDCNEP